MEHACFIPIPRFQFHRGFAEFRIVVLIEKAHSWRVAPRGLAIRSRRSRGAAADPPPPRQSGFAQRTRYQTVAIPSPLTPRAGLALLTKPPLQAFQRVERLRVDAAESRMAAQFLHSPGLRSEAVQAHRRAAKARSSWSAIEGRGAGRGRAGGTYCRCRRAGTRGRTACARCSENSDWTVSAGLRAWNGRRCGVAACRCGKGH